MLDIAIIGGGPAGFTAGLYAARAGLKAVLFEKLVPGGQIATTNVVENFPGFPKGVGGPEFSALIEEQAKAAGLEVRYADVKGIELEGDVKRIALRKETVEARAVILCMGASPRRLGAAGEAEYAGRGVSYCATCDGAFYKGKPVVVVGGGDTAAEDALYLARMASEVHLVHRRDALRAAHVLGERLQASGVKMHWNSILEGITGDSAVERVTIQGVGDGERCELEAAAVFVAVGNVPNNQILQGQPVGMTDAGYVIAGEDCRTNVPGVFVAGDLRTKEVRQIVTATADGAVASIMAERFLTTGEWRA